MNQQPVLRRSAGTSKPAQKAGGGRSEKEVKKNDSEKVKRDGERRHLERISRLFKAPRQPWSKKDVLSLGKTIFLIDGRD